MSKSNEDIQNPPLNYPEYLPDILEDIAKKYEIVNPKIKYTTGSAEGDGFVAKVCRASITGSNDKRLSMICKYQSNNDEHRIKYSSDKLFEREMFMYNYVLPELDRIQKEFSIDENNGFYAYPKCYYASHNPAINRSILILEDLCELGYKVNNHTTLVGPDHVIPLFKKLGRLHAVSFAVRQYNPSMLEIFRKLTDLLCDSMSASTMVEQEEHHRNLIPAVLHGEDDNVIRKVMYYKENLWMKLLKVVDGNASEPFNVVTHGDCWINNLMYNYGTNNSVASVMLLDFQHSRFASPVTDLTYFLFTCTDQEFRAKYFTHLIDVYHESVSELLFKFNLNPEIIFSKDVLWDHIKQFGKFVLGIAIFGIPLLCRYRWDANEDDEKNSQCYKIYKVRMADTLKDMVKFELL